MARRLRRWIALDDDEDNNVLPYHLDEQGSYFPLSRSQLRPLEQEEVIKTLKTQNTQSNDFFKVYTLGKDVTNI